MMLSGWSVCERLPLSGPQVAKQKDVDAIVRKAVVDVLPSYEMCLRTGRPPKWHASVAPLLPSAPNN